MRTKLATLALIPVFFLLVLGLLNLQLIKGDKYRKLSDKNCIRLIPQLGIRGRISDRNNFVIVDSILSYDVMILPREAGDIDQSLLRLSGILNTPVKDLKENFINNMVSASIPAAVAKNIDAKKAIALEELKIDFPGLVIQPNPIRHYRYGKLACHILGYLNEIDRWRLTKLEDYGYKTKDIVGFGGIEEKYDYYLRQEDGGLSVEVDRKGRFVRVLGFRPPKNGKNIQLTIDMGIQKIAEDVLGERKGSVIVMQPDTGAVLAMVSRPNFNPYIFIKRSEYLLSHVFNNPDAPLFNRSISGAYPPGSVFKAIVSSAGLETGKITLRTVSYCPGYLNVGNHRFNCWSTHGQQGIIDAIAHSCDVFFYRAGLSLGPQMIYEYAVKFGLAKPTGIDLPYEVGGFVPHPLWKKIYRFRNWFNGDTVNLSIGQGDLLVTPLQMTRMMAAFANKGKLATPYLVKAVEEKDISAMQQKITNLGLKAATIEYVRQGLREVVSDAHGTGNILGDLPVSVAGKTGTAEVDGKKSHAWFTGFFPYKDPKFVICVFLEYGGHGLESCILTKEIISRMYREGYIER
ncbi:MAG: penicillin-binding protein 2 [Candidatus Omnitrophota bacterium]|nr:penicillin-binding protein 2 [Candidatus Omnitrophota bacterium]MBU1928619.1 penicillin-binding protein 2 [Candidatus Omnitrophota bacterium]MBU2034763.1 penicillin-binding protein 2 [Candidatus Omnitrophota bacterium]